ncbi:glutathione S-transferase A4-like [Solea senegalensis]|uniref:glutathione transferase n=1 Tax=Solea senegalensis TaxID=28829 RepID=A0AAV6S2R8_SOLSE|nr:glutathione S-transferase A4-like [Solea senegalensis]
MYRFVQWKVWISICVRSKLRGQPLLALFCPFYCVKLVCAEGRICISTSPCLACVAFADGDLMFQQVPLVEIDNMKLVQTKAIMNYIAEKYNLNGKDLKNRAMYDPVIKQCNDRTIYCIILLLLLLFIFSDVCVWMLCLRINMYTEGLMDLMEMIMVLPFIPDPKPKVDNIQTKAKERFLPVFEKALCGPIYLVGGELSRADVHLLECSLMLEEKLPGILSEFPNIKSFQGRMTQNLAIKKFLEPGSKRKPQPDDVYVKQVKEVLQF